MRFRGAQDDPAADIGEGAPHIITSEGATVASTVTYLLPVVAIALGVLVLNETITVTVLAGIALVLAGVALTRRGS